jgi:hypothetical protein
MMELNSSTMNMKKPNVIDEEELASPPGLGEKAKNLKRFL